MLFHAGFYYENAYGETFLRQIFPDMLGIYGVSIFFAISGYLMAELLPKQSSVEFLTRRILRIYPVFVIATIGTLIVRSKILPTYDIASMSLAPIGQTQYPLGVEWTLVYEVFFYVFLFGISFFGMTHSLRLIAAIWIIVTLAYVAIAQGIPTISNATITQLPFMPANAGFAAGLLIPWLVKLVKNPVPLLCVFAISIAISIIYPISPFVRIITGIGCAGLIASAVITRDFLPDGAADVLTKLGDWSYALYLLHVPILFVVFRPQFASMAPIALIGGVFLAISASAVLGQIDLAIVEKTRKLPIGSAAIFLVVIFLITYFSIAITYI